MIIKRDGNCYHKGVLAGRITSNPKLTKWSFWSLREGRITHTSGVKHALDSKLMHDFDGLTIHRCQGHTSYDPF